MSLSRSVFENGWSMLATRFNVREAAKEGYYEYLGPRMEDDGFKRACKWLFANSVRFPIPVAFVDAAPEATAETWSRTQTWTCEECGGIGRSLGFPLCHVCSQCIKEIGRDRLRQLKADGKSIRELGGAMNVGLGVVLEARGQPGL